MSLLKLPPDTEKMRKLFFDMPVPFCVRADVFERYWPLSDNFWSRYNEITLKGSDNVPYNVMRWFCRLAPREPDKELKEGQTPTVKRARKDLFNCSCRIKAFVYKNVEGAPDHYQFEHANTKEADWQHRHTQDDADKHRLNSFLKGIASVEVVRGYTAADAYKILRSVKLEDAEPWNTKTGERTELALVAAGGQYMTRQHVFDSRSALKRSSELNRIDRHAEITGTDTAKIWPVTLGRGSEDYGAHAEFIKEEVAALITSVDLGGRTAVPSRVVMPLLNSIAAFMEKQIPVSVPEKEEEPVLVDEPGIPTPNLTPATAVESNPSSTNVASPPHPPSQSYPHYPPQNHPPYPPYAPQPPYPPYPPNHQHPGYHHYPPYAHTNYPPGPGGAYYGPPPPGYLHPPPPGPGPIHGQVPRAYLSYGPPPSDQIGPPPPHSSNQPLPRPSHQALGVTPPPVPSAEGGPITPVNHSTKNEDENKRSDAGEGLAVQREETANVEENKKRKRKRKKKGDPSGSGTYTYVFERCGG